MSVDTPDKLPQVFSAGETVKYRRFVPDYLPSDGWSLSLHLNGALATLHKTGVTDGDGYIVTIDATDTLPAGIYRYMERVTNGTTGEVHRVGSGVVNVEIDLATALAGAMLTHPERMLLLIEAALEEKIPADLQSYSIGGRAIVKYKPDELKKLRAQYRAEVYRLYNPGRLAPDIEIVFNPLEDTHALPSTWIDVTGIPE